LMVVLPVAFFLLVMTMAVSAQEEIPDPYAGLENLFSWQDEAAIAAGEELYKQACLGCHGLDGSHLSGSDFSAVDYPQKLENRADFYFWILSAGALERGMPGYKSSLAEEERWQMITYLHSLGAVPEEIPETIVTEPAEVTPGTPEVTPGTPEVVIEEKENILKLIAPGEVISGQPVLLTAYLWDGEEKPIADATVEFFIRVDFFATDDVKIGETKTDDEGKAVIEYSPRLSGDLEIVARYETVETVTALYAAATGEPLYKTEAGLHLPAPGTEIFIGPPSSLGIDESGSAPTSAFRLPGGVVSWLLILVGGVALIWATYLYVMYQVFVIPIRREIKDTNTRLIPLIGMAAILGVAAVLMTMLLTGPYSQFHLF
ncbi:MAG: c-type cytochrome, partial [Dehalococcoidales bacterium]